MRQQRRERIRQLWQRQKLPVLRIVIVLVIVINLAAVVFSDVAGWLAEQQHVSFALVFVIIYLLVDILVEGSSMAVDQTRSVTQSEMRPDIARAFSTRAVSLDIAAFTSETYWNLLSESLRRAAEGDILVERLQIRLLVPDYGSWMTVPYNVETAEGDEEYIQTEIARIHQINIERFKRAILGIRESAPSTRHEQIQFSCRKHRLLPLFKLIIINASSGFFSLYPIEKTPYHNRELWDFRGHEANYVAMAASGTVIEMELFEWCQKWFNTIWEHLSVEEVTV